MASSINTESLEIVLREKLMSEICCGRAYDALQYVQSFTARKKRTFGPILTSYLIFFGARILMENGSDSYAGVLLTW